MANANQNIFSTDSSEQFNFGDAVLQCINEMRTEQDMEAICQESAADKEAGKSFNEVLEPDHLVPNPNLMIFSSDKNYFVGESSYNPNLRISDADLSEDCDFRDLDLDYINLFMEKEHKEDNVSKFQESTALHETHKSCHEAPLPNPNIGTLGADLSKGGDIRVDLKYIDLCMEEEDKEDSVSKFQESAALEETHKSFYEALHQVPNMNIGIIGSDGNNVADESSYRTTVDPINHDCVAMHNSSVDVTAATNSPIPYNDGLMNFCVGLSDNQSLMQFQKGAEIPGECSSPVDFVKDIDSRTVGDKGKKNVHNDEDDDLEHGRSSKQSAVYIDQAVRSDHFDSVLLIGKGKNESVIREAMKANKSTIIGSRSKGLNGKKSRGKKHGGERNVADLEMLLMICAQAVGGDDRSTANKYLKLIRQHSSPTGDGMERLAHYFANGLEARLYGTSTYIYREFIRFPVSANDLLKSYQVYVATCPYWKTSVSFSNKTIWKAAENAPQLHIVDFGILYGFQWPCLIQRLSSRPGGPPRLRITGIDLPHPGFRPAERVEQTGDRLANYAAFFKVPFQFKAIAQSWETIKIEDLDITEGELLIVNCLYRLRNLLDETVVINSPRNTVLELIKEMNPHTFIMGIVNGPCNAPFFVSRFKQALMHFSAFFDMLEANFPRDTQARFVTEESFFGKEAMNIIACEGAERVERPDTYKQWHATVQQAGFKQLPLNKEIVDNAKVRVKAYHKDFMIENEKGWLLQCWKGRIAYALSSWRVG